MNINLTLILQSIAMMIFVWFCMKFLWPPIIGAIEERKRKIADGLAASARADRELEQAQAQVDQIVNEARNQANEIIEQSNKRAAQILESAKEEAVDERKRQVAAAEAEIEQAAARAREALREQVARLVVLGAEKVIEKEIRPDDHKALLDKLASEV